jgi:hypothetical protein
MDKLSPTTSRFNLPVDLSGRAMSEESAAIAAPDSVALHRKGSRKAEQDTPPSMLVMQQLCKGGGRELSNAHTKARAEELLAKQKEGMVEETIVNNDKHIHLVYHGVPSQVKLFDHKGVTFRHYFGTTGQKQSAVTQKALVAGPVAYAQVSPGYRADYVDLVGVFLTKPDVKPEQVGVPGHGDYVDMRLPADTAVLEIEPGAIYLVPGDPKRPDWIVDYYNKFKAGEKVPDYVMATIKKIDAEGGLKEPTKVYFQKK